MFPFISKGDKLFSEMFFILLLLKTKEIQKGSRLLLSQLFPTPLEINPTVKLAGVNLKATQQPTNTKRAAIWKRPAWKKIGLSTK